MIKLFASDLDGTLLNEKHESDEVIEQTIQNIIESGRTFAAATGRSAAMVNFHDLTDKVYIICMNGSDLGTKPGAFAFFHNIKRSPS